MDEGQQNERTQEDTVSDSDQKRRLPYLFHMASDGRDIHFSRIGANDTRPRWGLHSDFSEGIGNILIFIRGDTPSSEIMDAINRAQTYWREQTEPIGS